MSVCIRSERPDVALVDLVDFKWLMAHEGHAVSVERLQCDPVYARDRFELAAASKTAVLRHVAAALRRALAVAG